MARNIHATYTPSKRLPILYGLLSTVSLLFAEGGADFLPLLATWLAGVAVFQKTTLGLRFWWILSELTYVLFAVLITDWIVAVQSLGMVVMCLVGQAREKRLSPAV